MKKVNDVLQEYFSVIRELDLDKFEESFIGPDPYYANRVVKRLEHIFFDEYGNAREGNGEREYLLKPVVLGSKKAGIAVVGISLCIVEDTKRMSGKDSISVLRFLVPERYQKSERWSDYLQCVDHVNDGKICYYPESSSTVSQSRKVRMYDGQPGDKGWSFSSLRAMGAL